MLQMPSAARFTMRAFRSKSKLTDGPVMEIDAMARPAPRIGAAQICHPARGLAPDVEQLRVQPASNDEAALARELLSLIREA